MIGDPYPKRGRAADQRRIALSQAYEVSYFARKHGLTAADARKIIQQAGGSREKANRLAEKRNAKARFHKASLSNPCLYQKTLARTWRTPWPQCRQRQLY